MLLSANRLYRAMYVQEINPNIPTLHRGPTQDANPGLATVQASTVTIRLQWWTDEMFK